MRRSYSYLVLRAHPTLSSNLLDLSPNFVQELRGEVGSVGPLNRVRFDVDPDLFEQLGVLEGLEDLPVEFSDQVHRFYYTVAKGDSQLVVFRQPDIDNM